MLVVRNLINREAISEIMGRLHAFTARGTEGEVAYEDIDLNSYIPIPSHWDVRYGKPTWQEYCDSIPQAIQRRAEIFRQTDPLQLASDIIRPAGPRIPNATHPTLGFELYAGLIRSGCPSLHYDWCVEDIENFRAVAQLGWSIYLNTDPAGTQVRVYDMHRKDLRSEFRRQGNYGFDQSCVQDLTFCEATCFPGDFMILNTQYLHQVVNSGSCDVRWSVAAHVAIQENGSMCQFS